MRRSSTPAGPPDCRCSPLVRLGARRRQPRWVFAVIVSIWGVRLVSVSALHAGDRPSRRRSIPGFAFALADQLGLKFFVFFQAQAILDVVLSIPFLLAARHGGAVGPVETIAVVLWAMAIAGETAADYQLARFKADPPTRAACAVTGSGATPGIPTTSSSGSLVGLRVYSRSSITALPWCHPSRHRDSAVPTTLPAFRRPKHRRCAAEAMNTANISGPPVRSCRGSRERAVP